MKQLLTIFISMVLSQLGWAQCLDSLNTPNLQPPCNPDFVPVCGCDGLTYRNGCYAEYATVVQYTDGPCEQVVIDFYPNPAIDWLYLSTVTKFESDVQLYIFDHTGNIFYYQYLRSVTQLQSIIPLSGFENGLYIIMAESNGVVELSKFIKWER